MPLTGHSAFTKNNAPFEGRFMSFFINHQEFFWGGFHVALHEKIRRTGNSWDGCSFFHLHFALSALWSPLFRPRCLYYFLVGLICILLSFFLFCMFLDWVVKRFSGGCIT